MYHMTVPWPACDYYFPFGVNSSTWQPRRINCTPGILGHCVVFSSLQWHYYATLMWQMLSTARLASLTWRGFSRKCCFGHVWRKREGGKKIDEYQRVMDFWQMLSPVSLRVQTRICSHNKDEVLVFHLEYLSSFWLFSDYQSRSIYVSYC